VLFRSLKKRLRHFRKLNTYGGVVGYAYLETLLWAPHDRGPDRILILGDHSGSAAKAALLESSNLISAYCDPVSGGEFMRKCPFNDRIHAVNREFCLHEDGGVRYSVVFDDTHLHGDDLFKPDYMMKVRSLFSAKVDRAIALSRWTDVFVGKVDWFDDDLVKGLHSIYTTYGNITFCKPVYSYQWDNSFYFIATRQKSTVCKFRGFSNAIGSWMNLKADGMVRWARFLDSGIESFIKGVVVEYNSIQGDANHQHEIEQSIWRKPHIH